MFQKQTILSTIKWLCINIVLCCVLLLVVMKLYVSAGMHCVAFSPWWVVIVLNAFYHVLPFFLLTDYLLKRYAVHNRRVIAFLLLLLILSLVAVAADCHAYFQHLMLQQYKWIKSF